MLEQLRRNSRSWLIWFIFAILIAAFVLFFGPQSGPEMFGCAGSATTVAEVDGEDIEAHSWRFAMNSLGGTTAGDQAAARRAAAIDKLVEREILAAEAERLGMMVSDDLVREKIKIGEIYLLGQQVDGKRIFFQDGLFSFRFLELWVKNSGLSSVDAFIGEQKREVLANLARDFLINSTSISLEEARSEYVENNTTISIDYVSFPVSRYAAALELSEADAASYAAVNEEAIKKAWDEEKAQFSTDKDRVLARIIVINKAPPAPTGDAPPPADFSWPAKAKAEEALERATGGEDFAALARELSSDTRSKKRGGLLGWRSADALGYGTAVVDAVKKLEPGKVSGLIEGPRGYHIVKLEQRADKALTYEQRKSDIAYRLAARYYAEKLAARDAAAALEKASGTTLAAVFERKQATPNFQPGGPGGQFTPEQLKMIQEQLQKNLEQQEEQKKNEAGDDAETDGTDGTDDTNEAPAAPAVPDEDKTGWLYREGEIVFAQGGAGSAAPVADAEPPVAAAPSNAPAGDLPEADVGEPQVEKLGPLSRPGDKLAGIGRSKELIRDLFEKLEAGQLGAKVYEVSDPDGQVIVQLLDRTEADLERFAKEADVTRERMALAQGVLVVHAFIERRCRELAQSGDIGVNNAYLIYDEDKPPIKYTACATLSQQDVLVQLASRYQVLREYLYGQ